MNYRGRIANAKELTDNVEILHSDEGELQAKVTSQNSDEDYLVSCCEELWHCDCPSFYHNGLNTKTKLFMCKHIMSVLFYLKEQ